MPNGERISEERFREWEKALAPYGNDVEEFAREKGLIIEEMYHISPNIYIGRTQEPADLDKVCWTIQLGYNDNEGKFDLAVTAWIDTKYDVPEGRVNQRRRIDPSKKHIASWAKGDPLNIQELLDIAYERATSYTEQDLTMTSAVSVTGKDGGTGPYNPQFPSQT